MKRLGLSASVGLFAGLMIVGLSPVQAQAPDIARQAEQSCTQNAEAEGYTVDEVVSVGPSDKTPQGAKVVLSLSRDGQQARLTCDYNPESQDVSLGDTLDAVGATAPDLGRLWWLLVPLLGLPLLLWFLGGRDRGAAGAAVAGRRYDAYAKGIGDTVDVRSGPAASYRVIRTIRNGDRVTLTGRSDQNWAELEDGGWVDTADLSTTTSYVNR